MSLNSKVNSLKSSGSLTRILEVPKSNLGSNKNITSRLNLARKKLLPVINKILKTASENTSRLPYQTVKSYHLTIEQYKDAIWAANVLKEVDEILKFSKVKRLNSSVKPGNFSFDTKNIKVNKSGKIYVDTPILVQLIDLHNMLGDIIDYIKDLPAEGQKLSKETQKKKVSSQYKSNTTSSASMDKKKKAEVEKMTKEILTTLTLPLNTNFLVMAANSVQKSKMPCLPEEKSTSEINLPPPTIVHVRHCKSTGSVMNTKQKSKVVDAVAARKIIIRCLADLDRVKQYLEHDSSYGRKTPSAASFVDDDYESHENNEPCVCCECPTDDGEPLNFVWKDDGENGSKLIICIKGKSEDDGDIHVVIRQCPECLQTPNKKSAQRFDVSIENLEKPPKSKISFNRGLSGDRALSRAPSRQSQNDAINVLFDPDEPSQSVVEGPQLKLYETINLNLQNDEGQDLVISLCVKPKCRPQNTNSGFNLDEIFSECLCKNKKSRVHVVERMMPLLSRTKICSSMEFDVDLVVSRLNTTGAQHPNPEISERLNDLGVYNILRASRPVRCGRKAILNEHQRKSLPYSVSLRSLPLDDNDIAMINQSINMSLHKSKHSRIFPDSKDMDSEYRHHVRSINMSLHESKHSEIFPDSKDMDSEYRHHVRFEKCVYFLQITQQCKFFDDMDIGKWLIKKKLSFYIYLEDDIRRYENSYEVRYFNVENRKIPVKIKTNPNINHASINRKPTTFLPKNSRSPKKFLKTKIPIYVKNYATRNITQLNATQKVNNNYQRLINSDLNSRDVIIPRVKSKIQNIIYNESVTEIKKTERSCDKINNNTIKIIFKETVNNDEQINKNFNNNINIDCRKQESSDFNEVHSTSSRFIVNKNITILYQDLDKTINEINSDSMSSDSVQSINNINDKDISGICHEIDKKNNRMNNDSEINYTREIKSSCNKTNSTSCQQTTKFDKINGKIAKIFRSECNINKTGNCISQRKKFKHKIKNRIYEQINGTKKVEIIVNTVLNNGDNDCNDRKERNFGEPSNIKQEKIEKSKKLINTVLKKVIKESFEITDIKQEAIRESTKLMNTVINRAMKEAEMNRNIKKIENLKKRSFIVLKKAEENTGEQNSLASAESAELFKNWRERNESFSLKSKKRRKKNEFYMTRSHSQLLVGRTLERKITFIDFTDFFTKKTQKRSNDETRLDVALSSTRFKRDLNLGRTLSKMIVNNFSKFLYDAIIRELSTETKLEILSKIDEFLGKYCKLKSVPAKPKGPKCRGRCCS